MTIEPGNRVRFKSWRLPWALLAPQVIVIAVYFWPAAQALVQSLQRQDGFGMSVDWVGMENVARRWNDPSYLAPFNTTVVFSVLVAGLEQIKWSLSAWKSHCRFRPWVRRCM